MKHTRYAMLQNIRRNASRIALLAEQLEPLLDGIDENPNDIDNGMKALGLMHNIWMSANVIEDADTYGCICQEFPEFTKWAMKEVQTVDCVNEYNTLFSFDFQCMPAIPVSEMQLEIEYQSKVLNDLADSLPDLPDLSDDDVPIAEDIGADIDEDNDGLTPLEQIHREQHPFTQPINHELTDNVGYRDF